MREVLEYITESQLAIILGTILGDAHIQRRGNSYRLKIEHEGDQEAYVYWKYSKLENLCRTTHPPKKRVTKKGYVSFQFHLSSSKWMGIIHNYFYKELENGRYLKVITPELIEALPVNPLLLAVMFMDDGSVRDDCYSGKIATQGFTKEEQHLLAGYLEKYGLYCKVVPHVKEKNQYYLSVPAKSFPGLVSNIETVVNEIPDMVYKLNIERKPRND